MRLSLPVPVPLVMFIFTAIFIGIGISLRIINLLLFQILFACIVLTESAPHSADIGAEAFEELVRNYLQAGKSE